jgi:SM-20-related protein
LSTDFEQDCVDLIADGLAGPGWIVVDDFFGRALISALRLDCLHARDSGHFRPAAVGSGKERRSQPGVRGDEICWLQQSTLSDPQRTYLDRFEQLRLALNRTLQLGLFEFESCFARYPAGARYSRHVDQFRGDDRRRLSSVLYLNQNWSALDGGELRLYLDGEGARFEDVSPLGGRLVVFLSARFEHEVLPAKCERISIAGWFKRR